LREETRDWGEIGYCFASLEDYVRAATWMHDWRQRRDLQPWMLINLALSLRGLGDDAQANEVSRHAGELPPDYTSPYHQTWLAFDAALAGDGAAIERLKGLDVSSFDNTHKYVHHLVEVLSAAQQAAPPERPAAFRSARRKLDEAVRTITPLNDDRLALRRAYRRCVSCLAQIRGGVPALMWGRWRSWRPLLPAATAIGPNGR
jgi:hypothetical protein